MHTSTCRTQHKTTTNRTHIQIPSHVSVRPTIVRLDLSPVCLTDQNKRRRKRNEASVEARRRLSAFLSLTSGYSSESRQRSAELAGLQVSVGQDQEVDGEIINTNNYFNCQSRRLGFPWKSINACVMCICTCMLWILQTVFNYELPPNLHFPLQTPSVWLCCRN